MTRLYDVVVKKRHVQGQNVAVLEFESIDATRLPKIEAGSHIDVHLPNGLVRQYSICQDPRHEGVFRLGILKDPASRGGSESAFNDLQDGMHLQVSEPKNLFPLVKAKHSVLIGGGIGITPILCMAERLAAIGADFELHYCSRSKERTAFLRRIQSSSFAERVHLHFDDEATEQRLNTAAVLSNPDVGTHMYVCGPKGFMDHVMSTARDQHWSDTHIHCEYFAGAVTSASGHTQSSFEIRLASNGRVISVQPDQSIATALAAHGVEVPVSCEQGVCGTCVTRVLAGVPDHRDLYFTDEEKARNDQMTVCCSRAHSAQLVLDL